MDGFFGDIEIVAETIRIRRLEKVRRPTVDPNDGHQTIEIERKFLVDAADLPIGYEAHPRRDVIQGYVAAVDDGREVRLRTKGGRYFLTIKGAGLQTRFETEVEISKSQFDTLWPATVGYRIEKVRYEIPYGEHMIELDIFRGDLDGLITSEVEFNSKKCCGKFRPPKWFGREVTQDIRYKNKTMSRYGLPKGVRSSKANKAKRELRTTIVPIRIHRGDVEFCLVTTPKKGKWTFPSGRIGLAETYVEAAVKEAHEEAGLRGHIWGDPLGKLKRRRRANGKRSTKTESTVVLLVVTACDSTWPDAERRQRRWVSEKQAAKLLKSAKLRRYLQTAQARVNGASYRNHATSKAAVKS